MNPARRPFAALLLGLLAAAPAVAEEPPPISERARRVHDAGLLFDGHNDLPCHMRDSGDMNFSRIEIGKRLNSGHTDIPRARAGGLKAQFWSVFIASEQTNPARTVAEQIDLVRRMVERYPDDLALANSADDVERIVKAGKIASLIGIEGGVAIENDLAMIRVFADLGARYMTLTHNKSLDWVDAATDPVQKCDGLSPFGERVVKEMNRAGMLVDISHVAPSTMADALRISTAPIIASHSGAFAICPHPRNIPDEILKGVASNGGVVMVNFYSAFVVSEATPRVAAARKELMEKYPDKADFDKAYGAWCREHHFPRGSVSDVADHIDHIVKVAGIDHVGIGSDFDGVTSLPFGLEDVSCYPRLTEELLNRGHSEADVYKVLGGNILRAFREAAKVSEQLKKTTPPDIGVLKP